jgi:EmrB/QacA subfamily drug resistance transporter
LKKEENLSLAEWKPSAGQPCDEGVIRASPATVPCSRAAAPWVLAATILGSSLAFIDSSVVNLALPALQADLGATVIEMQWVVEAYALALAALILAGGSLGDIYGRRRIYAVGVVVFAAASIWCGLAPDIAQLIFARTVQGIGAALLVPGSLAIISASFPEEERGRAIGTWSGFTSLTAAGGPVLGGFLIAHGSWRWAFFINLPLALVVLAITFRRVPESRAVGRTSQLDWTGVILATAGLGGVTYALLESSNLGWTDVGVKVAIISGAAALVAFVIVEVRAAMPLVPLSFFRSRNFTAANLLTLFLYAGLNGLLFFFPLNLIQVQGYSPASAGASMLPFVILMFLLSRWSGGLIDRYGAKTPLVAGPMVVALGFLLFAAPSTGGNYWTTFFPAVAILGLGMSISVAPLTTTVMNSVPQERAGTASGINNAISRLAAVLSIAVMGLIMLAAFNRQLHPRLAAHDLGPAISEQVESQRTKLTAIKIPDNIEAPIQDAVRESINEAFVSGFRVVMIAASSLAMLSSVIAVLIIKGKSKPER